MRKIAILFAITLSIGCVSTSTTPVLEHDRNYVVEWIGSQPLIDRSRLSVTLNENNQASGFAGCNNWSAQYHLREQFLEFENISTTRKLCAPSLMQQEQRFLDALSQVHRWSFSQTGQLQLWFAPDNAILLWPDTSKQIKEP